MILLWWKLEHHQISRGATGVKQHNTSWLNFDPDIYVYTMRTKRNTNSYLIFWKNHIHYNCHLMATFSRPSGMRGQIKNWSDLCLDRGILKLKPPSNLDLIIYISKSFLNEIQVFGPFVRCIVCFPCATLVYPWWIGYTTIYHAPTMQCVDRLKKSVWSYKWKSC